jgi:hypothetical protein
MSFVPRVVLVILFLSAAQPAVSAQCATHEVPVTGGPSAGAEAGSALALAGDLALIGAPGWNGDEGRVSLALWMGAAWMPGGALPKPTSIVAGDRFGTAVALNETGDVAVVGAPGHDGGLSDVGMIAIYEKDPGTGVWWLVDERVAGSNLEGLGSTVSASGDVVVAGAPLAGIDEGAAIVYRRSAPSTWVEEAILSGAPYGARLGHSVAVSGDLLVAGAPDDRTFDPYETGSVWTYERVGGSWSLVDVHTNPFEDMEQYGWSLDLSDEYLIVSAPADTLFFQSSCAVWRWASGAWEPRGGYQYIPGGPSPVVIAPDLAVTGYPLLESGGPADAGLFNGMLRRVDDLWSPIDPGWFTSPQPEADAHFGAGLALDGERLLVGSPLADSGSHVDAGAVHAYEFTKDSAVFTDLGHALAGHQGQAPLLQGQAFYCMKPRFDLYLSGQLPQAPTWVVLGVDLLEAPFKGGVLVPTPDLLIVYSSSWLQMPVPLGLPAFGFNVQYWIQDPSGPAGFSASNALHVDVPDF